MRIEYFYKAEHTKICFIFSNAAIKSFEENSSGGSFLLQEGFDVINFKNMRLDWYQYLPEQFFKNIDHIIFKKHYSSRVAMGHSMGAYAALCFSRRFNFDICLAYSPQANHTQFEDFRFIAEARKVDHWRYLISKETVSTRAKYFLVYDNQDLDQIHAEKLKEILPGSHLSEIILPHASHETTTYLKEIGRLKELTLSILTGEKAPISNMRRDRIKSGIFIEAFSQSLLKKGHKERLLKLLAIIKKRHQENQDKISLLTGDGEAQNRRIQENNYYQQRSENISHKILQCDHMRDLARLGFDEEFYLRHHPDIAQAAMPALYHFVCFGRQEGRAFRLKTNTQLFNAKDL